MKTALLSAAFVSLTAFSAMASPGLVTEAQRDYMAGRYADARLKFSQILAENPSNAVARNYLRMIDTAEKQAEKSQLQGQLQRIIVPSVAIREASFDSVMELLPALAEKNSNGAVKPSFVVEPGVNKERMITLQLSNVPFTEVMRYVGMQAGVGFKVEQYAVRVYPKTAETASPATTGATETP